MPAVTARRAGILRLVVQEHIETAAPVGSKTIHEKYGVPVSPATIRNEMQALEEDGLLRQPHPSAGRIPSDQGYRYFVQSLAGQVDLSAEEKATIRHQFFQAPPEWDEWVELAAVLLARSLGLLAVVAPPRARRLAVRRVELIRLNERLALLVVVVREARVLKQLVTLASATAQAELSAVARRLNERVVEKTAAELERLPDPAEATTAAVLHSLRRLLREEAGRDLAARVEGLPGVLAQPEFRSDHRWVLAIMSLVEGRAVERLVPPGTLGESGVRVVIGAENQAEELRECSVVMAPYGAGEEMTGFVGVVGPTRMRYPRGAATVRYLSDLLQEMMERVYS